MSRSGISTSSASFPFHFYPPARNNWLKNSQLTLLGLWLALLFSPGLALAATCGVNWSAQGNVSNLPSGATLADYQFTGIAWSGSQFVAVGFPCAILTSPDGSNWTSRVPIESCLPNLYELFGITWSGSQFVAVGYHPGPAGDSTAAILTSPNGITWTSRVSTETSTLNSIAWSGSKFVAVGYHHGDDKAAILTSSDGITWSAQTSPSANLTGITWSGHQFVAVGSHYNPDTDTFLRTIFTSTNGETWIPQASGIAGVHLTGVAWSGSQFVAVGHSFPGYEGKVFTSTNGSTWTPRSVTVDALTGITWSGHQFVAVSSTAILTSSDGITWARYDGIAGYPNGIVWSGSRFVAVGNSGTILTSDCPWGDNYPLTANLWSLIGLPATPTTTNTIAGVFSDDLSGTYGADWRVYQRNNVTPYVDTFLANTSDSLAQGVSYWIKHKTVSANLDLESGTTPTLTTGNSNCRSTVGCYEITLTAAPTGTGVLYNQISFPLPYPVAWWDVVVQVDGVPYTPSGANTYVNKTYWVWNGSSYKTYDDVTPGKIGILQPWQGLQVEVKAASRGHTVKLLFPALPKTSQILPSSDPVATQDHAAPTGWIGTLLDWLIAPASADEPTDGYAQIQAQRGRREAIGEREREARRDAHGRAFQDGREWNVRLIAEEPSLNLRNDDALFGQLDDARVSYDEYDLPTLPPDQGPPDLPADPATVLTVAFPHPDWGIRAGDYITDYRPTNRGAPPASWRFEIRTDSLDRTVQLHWDGPAAVLKRSVLIDEDLNTQYRVGDRQYVEDGISVDMYRPVRHFTWRYTGKTNGRPGKDD